MTQATHTPRGEMDWRYFPEQNIVGAPVYWNDDEGRHFDYRFPRIVAELPDDWEQKKQGPIIAAAPDMLAALEWVADQDEIMRQLQQVVDECGNHICGNIRAAIAKALGEG